MDKDINRIKAVLTEKGMTNKQLVKVLGVSVDDLLWTEDQIKRTI